MLFAGILLTCLVGLALQGSALSSSMCSLNLQTDTDPYYEPLILNVTTKNKVNTYNFVWPASVDEQGVLYLANKQKLLLACPKSSYGNYQVTSGNEEAFAICKDGSLTINGTVADTTSTACYKSYAYSWLNITDTVCGSTDNSGIIVQIGFELEDDSYYPLAYSCFNITQAKVLWVSHQLMGASVLGRVRCEESRSFTAGPSSLWPDVYPADCYPKADQIKTFNAILGDGGADMYISDDNSLNRGHLAPHADFIYNSHRVMTYYYVNCAPQWYSFNAGNWEVIENFTRSIAQDVNITINIWTGTYGVLSLANTEGVETEIYLDADADLIPVPLVYWKLVNNPETNACTVVVGHNNPFLESAPTSLCKKVKPYGWPTLTSNLTYGYTYYCAYKTFLKVADYLPDVTCDSLFEFPE